MADVKFYKGTSAGYTALSKDSYTFYLVDNKDLYLGEVKLSNGADLAAAVARVAQNETDISKIQSDLKALVGSESGSIQEMIDKSVKEMETKLQDRINENAENLASEITRAQGAEATLQTGLDGANSKIAELQQSIESNKTAADASIADLTTKVNTNTENIANNSDQLNALDETVGKNKTEAAKAIEAVDAKIDKILGDDADTEDITIRKIASEETAKIVAGAPEKYDTLKEIADFIENDITGTATLTNQVSNNASAIENLNTEVASVKATDVAQDTKITALEKKASDNEKAIQANANAISDINNDTTGILAKAKEHTNAEIDKVNATVEANQQATTNAITSANEAISANTQAIAAINNDTTGILAKAKAEINTLKNSLGSAAYEDASAFEEAGAAAAAKTEANQYTDGKINDVNATIGTIKTALTWQDIA